MTIIEAYAKALKEFFGRKTYVITSNCIVFGDMTLRFRGPWLLIDERSYPCENSGQLLQALKSEGIKVSDYAIEAFPNRVQNLLADNKIKWCKPTIYNGETTEK